jgi:hypothetical protein
MTEDLRFLTCGSLSYRTCGMRRKSIYCLAWSRPLWLIIAVPGPRLLEGFHIEFEETPSDGTDADAWSWTDGQTYMTTRGGFWVKGEGFVEYVYEGVGVNVSEYIKLFFRCLVLIFACLGQAGPPLWSSGQSSWLQIRRPGFDSRHYQKKK